MTEPEPMDAAQRESLEHWNGYYAGKAAALRNGDVIARINLERSRRRLRGTRRAVAALDLSIFSAGFWLTWPGTLDHPSIWVHLAVGFVFGSWAGNVLLWWRSR